MSKIVEQVMYGTGWLKCSNCGLVDGAVVLVLGRAVCFDAYRCGYVAKGEPLGSPDAKFALRGPMVRFELDAVELALVDVAVKCWRLVNVDEGPVAAADLSCWCGHRAAVHVAHADPTNPTRFDCSEPNCRCTEFVHGVSTLDGLP